MIHTHLYRHHSCYYALWHHLNIDCEEFIAQWDLFGKSAGYKRNVKIIENSDIVVAFPVKGQFGFWQLAEGGDEDDRRHGLHLPVAHTLARFG